MLHHVSLGTNDLARARSFYDPLMGHLRLRCIKQSERILAYGLTEVLFSPERPVNEHPATAGNGVGELVWDRWHPPNH
jgi:catechol 2,3-dioxygenase-like lactoylglutathione lyase family enzyme